MKNLDESLLASIPPFRKLQRQQIREILDQAQPKRIDSGNAIFDQGMPATHFYLLLDGHIRVVKNTTVGDQVIVLHIASGQLFGIAVALGKDEYPASAIAARECLTLSWPNELWAEFVDKYDGFATETYKVVGDRIGEMNNRLVELATRHVEQRVAAVLLRLINQAGKKVATGIEIDFPITRQNISEMTGTTLHTVSRLLSGWERDGIVVSKRSNITITQPHQLVLLSGVDG
ncbi:Crp/Fnr family transcriptional regulator [Paramylibacter ulvae]|nr:Crp/Fnr family transcriptional regulator [Amylibacter ulvae]